MRLTWPEFNLEAYRRYFLREQPTPAQIEAARVEAMYQRVADRAIRRAATDDWADGGYLDHGRY